jgi:hypothetical protein
LKGALKFSNMIVKNIEIKSRTVWLAIDQLRTYSVDFKFIEEKSEFLCYFKLTEPNPIICGELLRDTDNKPILFKTVDEAIEKAKEILNKKL